MLNKKVLLGFVFCIVASFTGFSQDFQTYNNDPIKVKQIILKNGLTVMLSENSNLPQVFGMVVVKAGGKNDPSDATGLAHYLEHMLFKGTTTSGTIDYQAEKPYLDKINDLYEELGTTKVDSIRKRIQKEINMESILAGQYAIPNELDKMLAGIGATDVNAFTTEEYTAYINSFPSNQIEKWLEIYSHRFQEPVFRLFQSELETVYEEKNRGNDNAFYQVWEKFQSNFYKKHPYGQQSVIGTTEHLKNPPLKKMYEYYNRYYVANNMALILSGDFDSNEIINIIEAKFGSWRNAEIEAYPEYIEEPFKGKEVVEVKLTPVKAAMMGFRTVPNGHKDINALEILNKILSNEEQTGLIDKLYLDGHILMAGINAVNYNDYGGTMLFMVPKLIGQSIAEAESLVKCQLDLVKKGAFSQQTLNAVKLNLIKELSLKWENNDDRVMEMMDAFTQNKNWGEFLFSKEQLINISKEDIIRVANEYYGENYLFFVSRMGFPKKEKLPKPHFEPVIPKNEGKSQFYSSLIELNSGEPNLQFVDFEKDVIESEIKPGVVLKTVYNPFNDIFSLKIKYGIGSFHMPILNYTAEYLNMIGTDTMDVSAFKNELYELGCTYNFQVKETELMLTVEGPDASFTSAIKLIDHFINNPKSDSKKVKKLLEDEKVTRKIEKREPAFIASALQEYILYGNDSKFLRELGKKERKRITGEELLAGFTVAKQYEISISYSGNKSNKNLGDILSNNFIFGDSLKPRIVDFERKRNNYQENLIYVLNKSDAIQSQLFFNIEGDSFDIEEAYKIDAFNEYFGNNMSSLVFQEIREFRSLAYSARATYRKPSVKNKNNYFNGYIGCQADKTIDAMSVMLDLINNMPEKTERIEMVKSALIQSSQADKPGFRELSERLDIWKKLGYSQDPNSINIPKYKALTFDNINEVYNSIKGRPIAITIVGSTKRFDLSKLEKFGKVIMVKEKQIFNN